MTIRTVIDNYKQGIHEKLKNIKHSTEWEAKWEQPPTYFDFQNATIHLLDLSIKTNNFTELEKLDTEDAALLKEKVLTLLALSLNFSDLINYDFEEWLGDEN